MEINIMGGSINIASGNSKVTVNGKKINNNINQKTVNKQKKESLDGIRNILIYSDVDINMEAADVNEAIIHFHGNTVTDDGLKFFTKQEDGELIIKAEIPSFKTSFFSDSSNISFIGNNNFTLDIKVPYKKFEKIYIKTENGDIGIDGINLDELVLYNKNGDVDLSATFYSLKVECLNGDITFDTEARNDIKLNVLSKNGDIKAIINNIGKESLKVKSNNGSAKNKIKLNGQYTVIGKVESNNGDVKVY